MSALSYAAFVVCRSIAESPAVHPVLKEAVEAYQSMPPLILPSVGGYLRTFPGYLKWRSPILEK